VNYYQHHIGDFNSGTVRMPQLARWLYRDMIEVYYDTEKPLPLDFEVLCMNIGAVGEEQRNAVKIVLALKFKLDEDGYHHERCDTEIAAYRAKSDSARERGKLGGRPRKAEEKPKETYSFPEANPQDSNSQANETSSQANQEPITNNQEPKDKTRSSSERAARFDAKAWLAEKGVDSQHAADWLAVRSKKRAPNTLTAFEGVAREAEKAGITIAEAVRLSATRAWIAFEAKYLGERQSSLDLAKQVQQSAGPRSGATPTQKSRFDVKSNEYDGPTDAPFDF
jgi:uncharacterized protein YdaU (DUF1376 family)